MFNGISVGGGGLLTLAMGYEHGKVRIIGSLVRGSGRLDGTVILQSKMASKDCCDNNDTKVIKGGGR